MNEQNFSMDTDFEALMEQRMQETFMDPSHTGESASNERLREMNKKLPQWSLEPPYSFLK